MQNSMNSSPTRPAAILGREFLLPVTLVLVLS